MLTIEFTNEYVEGEPGPNFYWSGHPDDYLKLVVELHKLGSDINEKIFFRDLNYVRLINIDNVEAKSSREGKILNKKIDRTILIDINCTLWQEIMRVFLILSFNQGHYYLDFDNLRLEEDGNFIVSSEPGKWIR